VIGTQERWQEDLFVAGPLSNLIPNDHVLKRVDRVLDLSWLRKELKDCYSEIEGRPSIDPESALRLMLAGYFQGIVQDRKLIREAQVNLAIRWFAGFRLDEALPEHSSLTRIRQRWGAERFKKIFQKTVQMCIDAGLVNGETVHIDATLIRADVSWESITTQYAEKVIRENPAEEKSQSDGTGLSLTGRPKKLSSTDPDATLTTSSSDFRMEPSFKQHTAVDDQSGVILDVKTTTGEVSEGKELLGQIERVEETTGKKKHLLPQIRAMRILKITISWKSVRLRQLFRLRRNHQNRNVFRCIVSSMMRKIGLSAVHAAKSSCVQVRQQKAGYIGPQQPIVQTAV
jgi:transposase